jgi:uncharacterized membrane protein YwzB
MKMQNRLRNFLTPASFTQRKCSLDFNIVFVFFPSSLQGSVVFRIPTKIECDFPFAHMNIRRSTRHSAAVHQHTNDYFIQNSEYKSFATFSHLMTIIIPKHALSYISSKYFFLHGHTPQVYLFWNFLTMLLQNIFSFHPILLHPLPINARIFNNCRSEEQ